MRTYISLAFFVLAIFYSNAQDTLYKVDGSVHLVKIIEIKTTQVKYKKFSEQDGPVYVISKDYVAKILYEDGSLSAFPNKAPSLNTTLISPDPRTTDFGRHFVFLDVFDLFSQALTVGYEYTAKSGMTSITVPVSIGLGGSESNTPRIIFGTGLDLSYFPQGQGKTRFFIGSSTSYRVIDTFFGEGHHSSYSILGQFGVLFQSTRHFNISLRAGVGYGWFKANTNYENYTYRNFVSKADLNVGYKF